MASSEASFETVISRAFFARGICCSLAHEMTRKQQIPRAAIYSWCRFDVAAARGMTVSTGVGPSSYRNSGRPVPHTARRSMTALIVLPEQILAEVASEVAPDGMD